MGSPLIESCESIIDALKKRHPTSTESELEASIKATIESGGFDVITQKIITKRDRIDLFVPIIGLGVEVKIAGSYTRVAEQLLRYAEHEEVNALLLVTSKASHRQLADLPNDRNIPVWVLCTAIYSL
jgi:hypothetical protein